MKQCMKRILQVVFTFVLSFCFVFVAGNRQELTNRLAQYEYLSFHGNELYFYNWEKVSENNYISQEDPQIVISELDTYVNTIRIIATLTDNVTVSSEVIVYYTDEQTGEFDATYSLKQEVDKGQREMVISLNRSVRDLRIDLTELSNVGMRLEKIDINPQECSLSIADIILWALMLVAAGVVFYNRKFVVILYNERELLSTLVRNDLKSRYAGSFLGLIWAFVQPLLTILIFWLVFELGFRTLPVNNVRFILWFIPAYIPWIFFSDAVVNSTNCMREYSYLVKKIKFPIEILPIVKILSSLIIHSFFIVLMLIIFLFYRYDFTLMSLQIIYYVFALMCLLVGLSWLTSAIAVLIKDFTQVISVILQLGFFAVPIFWNDADMDQRVLLFLKLNPAYYLVQGYRDSMLGNVFFWERPLLTAYYWGVTIIVFVLGIKMFVKLRKHFADLI